jgi:thiol-disulfide isomerase/thioredoxin
MKKYDLSKLLSGCIFACLLASCSGNKNQFTVEGNIKNAQGKILYIENVGASSIALLDSIRIKGDGSFQFKHERPDVPDFYRIRLGNQVIHFAVDSTETIIIRGDTAQFAKNYTIEGSPESVKIKELTLIQLNANIAYNQLQKRYEAKEISMDEYVRQVNQVVGDYKTEAQKYIYSNPLSTSAYFALFQQINRMLIFDPYDKADSKAFGAVANSWNQYYAESPRAVQLYNLFTRSSAVLRGERSVSVTEGNSVELFDISLPSLNGKELKLSEAGKNKLTLIDFTAYGMKDSPAHNILLAEVYEQYKAKGFEIYQISIDMDEHFWKNASSNLPWVCVRDPQSVDSRILKLYNVSEIPTSYLRDKEGNIVARIESYKDLGKEITKYLK